ncbi:MAG: RNA polymerase sigma factor [Pseudonocardiaceae bacterium]
MTTPNISCAPRETAADLLLRAGDGDPAAWEEIVRGYGQLVSATVRSFRLQDADALDAVQTTWLRLAEHVHQIQHPERLGGWLVTTARRACLQILRHAKHYLNLCDPVAETVTDPVAGPEQCIIRSDSTRTLWDLVSELSPRRQTVLRALFTERPQPYAEVARLAEIPIGGIGPTRARALAQLRARIEQYELEAGACVGSLLSVGGE